jgi:hypothetical protein
MRPRPARVQSIRAVAAEWRANISKPSPLEGPLREGGNFFERKPRKFRGGENLNLPPLRSALHYRAAPIPPPLKGRVES